MHVRVYLGSVPIGLLLGSGGDRGGAGGGGGRRQEEEEAGGRRRKQEAGGGAAVRVLREVMREVMSFNAYGVHSEQMLPSEGADVEGF